MVHKFTKSSYRSHNLFSILYNINLFFAVIYYSLHKKSPANFLFNGDILSGKKEEIESQLNNEINTLTIETEALQHIVNEINKGKELKQLIGQDTSYTLPTGNSYQISQKEVSDPGLALAPLNYTQTEVNIVDSLGNRVGVVYLINAGTSEFNEYLRNNKKKLAQRVRRLETINRTTSSVWSYWDFFYFSASTQTTLGYGDILPNSSSIRRWVIIQVFFGLAILVLVINYVILVFK